MALVWSPRFFVGVFFWGGLERIIRGRLTVRCVWGEGFAGKDAWPMATDVERDWARYVAVAAVMVGLSVKNVFKMRRGAANKCMIFCSVVN